MYSFEQDHTAAAARTTAAFAAFDTDTTYQYQPCAGVRSLQLSAHHYPGEQALRAAAGSGSAPAAAALRPRRAKGSSRKHAPSSSRRSSTTVVATDVSNFRAMVQELTGFPPPAAVLRPLPRRVHAAGPCVAVAAAAGQGCGWKRHGHGSSEAANSSTAGGGSSPDDGPAVPLRPVVVVQQPQFAPLEMFDGLPDLGSPEFDSWGDLFID